MAETCCWMWDRMRMVRFRRSCRNVWFRWETWLKVNGEAIYGTRAWVRPCQWTKGNREWKSKEKHYVSGDAILKQTVDPEPGYAVKEVFFTKKRKEWYNAILPA